MPAETYLTVDESLSLLSPRKQRVALLVAQGFTDKTIAAMLSQPPNVADAYAGRPSISAQAVRNHVAGIARIWRLDDTRNLRVQIAQRVFFTPGVALPLDRTG